MSVKWKTPRETREDECWRAREAASLQTAISNFCGARLEIKFFLNKHFCSHYDKRKHVSHKAIENEGTRDSLNVASMIGHFLNG